MLGLGWSALGTTAKTPVRIHLSWCTHASPVWRFLPLHASPRPPLAEYVHSSRCAQQYASYSSSTCDWYRVCSCIVQGCTAATYALVQVQCWDFHFSKILRHPGERAIRPRESLSTPPARRVGHRRPFFRRGHRGLM